MPVLYRWKLKANKQYALKENSRQQKSMDLESETRKTKN